MSRHEFDSLLLDDLIYPCNAMEDCICTKNGAFRLFLMDLTKQSIFIGLGTT